MLVQLSGILDGSHPDDGIKFTFERGLLQNIIDKQNILKRRHAGLWWDSSMSASNEEEYHYRSDKRIRLDNKPNIFPPSVAMALVAVKTCDNQDHKHFADQKTAQYPSREEYRDTILVNRRDITGESDSSALIEESEFDSSFTTRTKRDTTESDTTVTPTEERNFQPPEFFNLNPDQQQFNYRAYFGTTTGLGYVKRIKNSSLKQLAEALISQITNSINKPFGGWMKSTLSATLILLDANNAAITDPATTTAVKGQLKIALPPFSKFTVNSLELWKLFGFEQASPLLTTNVYQVMTDTIVKDLVNNSTTGFTNNTNRKMYFQSTSPFTLADPVSLTLPSQHFFFKLSRKNTTVSKLVTFDDDALPPNHSYIPLVFFRRTLVTLVDELGLKTDLLDSSKLAEQVKLGVHSSKETDLKTKANSQYPLTIEFALSKKLIQVLNIEIPNAVVSPEGEVLIKWQPIKGPLIITVKGTADQDTPPGFLSSLETIFKLGTKKTIDWNSVWQQEGYDRSSANPEEDPVLVAQMEEKIKKKQKKLKDIDSLQTVILSSPIHQQYKNLVSKLTTLTLEETKLRSTYQTSMPRLLPSLDAIKTLLDQAKLDGSKESLKISKVEELETKLEALKQSDDDNDDSTTLSDLQQSAPESIAAAQELLTAHETQLNTIKEKLNHFNQVEILAESKKIAEEKIAEAEASAATTTTTTNPTTATTTTTTTTATATTTSETVTIVESVAASAPATITVKNPQPRRGDTFVVFSSNDGKTPCTTLTTFPTEYLILIDEGEPRDFVSNRGFCPLLGYVRNSSGLKIVNNTCIISNAPNIDCLHMRLIGSNLEEFKPASDKKIFFSLIVRLTSLNVTQ